MRKLVKHNYFITLLKSFHRWKTKLCDIPLCFSQDLKHKNIVPKVSLVAMLFLLAAAPTYAQDADNDSILDNVDLDDDNDGILDEVECDTITQFLVPSATTPDYAVNTGYTDFGTTTNSLGEVSNSDLIFSPATSNKVISSNRIVTFEVDFGDYTTTYTFDQPVQNPQLTLISLQDDHRVGNFTLELEDGTIITNPNISIAYPAVPGDGSDLSHLNGFSTSGAFESLIPEVHSGIQYVTGADGTANGSSDGQSSGTIYFDDYEFASSNGIVGISFDNVVVDDSNAPTDDKFVFGFKSQIVCDFDNDGTPNIFDLDSDDDGCPDALEGDAGFTNADIQNDTLTGGIDADGIPIAATSSGQATGSSLDLNLQSDECDSCNDPLLTDTDTDGIADVCDLDDDNDGILDTVECDPTTQFLVPNATTPDYAVNTGYTDFGTTTNNLGEVSNSDLIFSPATSNKVISSNRIVTFEVDFGDYTTTHTFDQPVQNPQLTLISLQDDHRVGNFTLELEDGTIINDPSISIAYPAIPGDGSDLSHLNGFSTSGAFESLIPEVHSGIQYVTGADGTANGSSDGQSSGTIYFDDYEFASSNGIVGISFDNVVVDGSNAPTDDKFVFGFKSQIVCDFDNDGTPNIFDLDSDDDGCPDALEGDTGFTNADIQNDTLTGGIDADGIPIAATSSGQATGSSLDLNLQSDECDSCNDPLLTDTDTDGIADVCDLDDDNDGILDTVECDPTTQFLVPNATTPDYAVNTGYSDFGTTTNNLGEVSNSDLIFSPATSNKVISSNRIVTFEVDFGDYTTTYTFDQPVQNPQLTLISLQDDHRVGNFTLELEDGTIINDPSISIAYPAIPGDGSDLSHLNGFSTSGAFESLIPEVHSGIQYVTGADGTANGSSDGQSSGTIYFDDYEFASSNGIVGISFDNVVVDDSNAPTDDKFVFGFKSQIVCDFDNDGTPNISDLDSDGDGCPDAIEGGGTFTNNDIQNDTLTGGVDADGIPIVATSAGQGVGESANAAIADCGCPFGSGNDNDGDGLDDACDLDDDNDGILDAAECSCSPCGNAILNTFDGNLTHKAVVLTETGCGGFNFQSSNICVTSTNWSPDISSVAYAIDAHLNGGTPSPSACTSYGLSNTTSSSATSVAPSCTVSNNGVDPLPPGTPPNPTILSSIFSGVDAFGFPDIPTGDYFGTSISPVTTCLDPSFESTDAGGGVCGTFSTNANSVDWAVVEGYVAFPPTPIGSIIIQGTNYLSGANPKASYIAFMVSDDENPSNLKFYGESQTQGGAGSDTELQVTIPVVSGVTPSVPSPCNDVRFVRLYVFDNHALHDASVLWSLDGGTTFTEIPTDFISTTNPLESYDFTACGDEDGDGAVAWLDTDSDNDGCPDALEGDGGFTFADIQNDTLTGGVDNFGVPIITTSTGQGIGTSCDPTQVGQACLTYAEDDINQTPQDVNVDGNILTNDTDPTDDPQTVQSATGLDAAGNLVTIPLDGAPTPIYDENGVLTGTIAMMPDGSYTFDPAPTFTGSVPVDYVVEDSNRNTDTAALNIEVMPTPSTDGSNNEVIAQDDTNTTEQGETVTTPLLANDSDPDADPLSVTAASGLDDTGSPVALTTTPQDIYDENGVLAGQASLDANGNVIFTADNDFSGDVPVNYTATDGTDTDDAVLVITVEPADPNDNDTYANDDASTGIQGADQTGNIITNDNDPEADDQDIQSILVDTDGDGIAEVITPVAGSPVDVYQDGVLIGTVDVDPETGDFTFAPEPDFVGTAVIPYTTTDGTDTDDATLYVTVLPNENTTVAENDINQTPQDTPVAGNVLTNDTDEEGDNQTVQSATFLDAAGMETNLPLGTPTYIYDEAGTLAGSITLNADGSYDFTPATDYTGEVPVEYVVVDDNGNPATDAATLAIEVMPADDPTQNDPPVANDDTNTTEMDTDVAGNVIDPNDTDPDGDALTVTDLLADTDGDGIVDDVVTLSAPTPVYGTDDNGNTVLAGTITLHASGNYVFDPEPTFTGEIPVDYTISDGNGGTNDATLTITVEPDNGNDTFANDDASTGDMGENQTGNILLNDNDPEADDQDIASILVDTDGDGIPEVVTPVAGTPTPVYQDGILIGEITVSPMVGSYDWNPIDTFVGTAVIPYTTTDNNGATDNATLYLTALPINTIASEDDFNNTPFNTPVSADVSTNDVDEEGDNLTFALDAANGGMDPADGSVTLNPDGSYTFTPANGFSGETSFQYSTCDDGTPALCDTSTVFLEVFPQVNPETPQVFANPDANTVESGQTGTGNVMSNDLDPDDLDPAVTTPLTAQTVPGVDEDGNPVTDAGTLTLNPDGSYSFTPTGNFTGAVTQPYTICNSEAPAVCDDTELIIDVIADTDNTTFANDDAEVTDAGVTVSNNVSDNDSDSEMDAQTITDFLVDTDGDGAGDTPGTVGTPTQVGGTNDMGVFVANAGEITLNADGSYSFTPAPGFVGNVNVPYTTCDNDAMNMACEDATLVITILDVKRDYGDAPVTYPIVWHRAVTDSNDDDVLDGPTDVWLGTSTNFEAAQPSSPTSTGDQFDDAITFGAGAGQFPLLAEAGATYDVDITVNSTTADLVFYAMWIDWDEDGIYDDFHTGSQVTASPATATVTITAPSTIGSSVNVRLRADDDPFVSTDFEGGKTNGEVEDFQALVVLPVTLTHFSGQTSRCNTELRWHAETEENFSHYDIERSGDGRLFSTIETIKGTGNANTGIWYTYTDKSASEFNYYRLKMVDLDGSFVYSKVINVNTDCTNDYKIEVYPNPTTTNWGAINVKFYARSYETQIQILDMQGRTVKQLTVGSLQDDLNAIQLDVTDLLPGSYHLNIIGGGENSTKSFIIATE